MSRISAKIIGHSISSKGNELISYELVFPRYILPEFNTHREFSRNSASSRAIPFNKMVESVVNNTFIPIAWQKHHKGMQGKEYHNDEISERFAPNTWLRARDRALEEAKMLYNNCEVTKQLANRLLEPFMWHKVIMTTSKQGLDNFFNLRCPQYYFEPDDISYKSRKEWIKSFNGLFGDKEDWDISRNNLWWLQQNIADGEIHISLLAEAMWDSYNESKPQELNEGDYHIPYGNTIEFIELTTGLSLEDKIKVVIGMCARVSYTTVDDESTPTAKTYISIYDKMVKAEPFHASPFEHVARVMTDDEYSKFIRGDISIYEYLSEDYRDSIKGWCRNFKGFIQERHRIEELKWRG